ncbi:hypothetical protein GQ44DRAFT_187906 [Phaeosphaeriaceae sp. PMI808]|nr:hypothetical protein GQ44DRAFT_187906 [Phaeosphaeriaceae sp. PMI808]
MPPRLEKVQPPAMELDLPSPPYDLYSFGVATPSPSPTVPLHTSEAPKSPKKTPKGLKAGAVDIILFADPNLANDVKEFFAMQVIDSRNTDFRNDNGRRHNVNNTLKSNRFDNFISHYNPADDDLVVFKARIESEFVVRNNEAQGDSERSQCVTG